MHLLEERPGEAPQGIIVAQLAGEAPLLLSAAATFVRIRATLILCRLRIGEIAASLSVMSRHPLDKRIRHEENLRTETQAQEIAQLINALLRRAKS